LLLSPLFVERGVLEQLSEYAVIDCLSTAALFPALATLVADNLVEAPMSCRTESHQEYRYFIFYFIFTNFGL
jgi:hypothetical protein